MLLHRWLTKSSVMLIRIKSKCLWSVCVFCDNKRTIAQDSNSTQKSSFPCDTDIITKDITL